MCVLKEGKRIMSSFENIKARLGRIEKNIHAEEDGVDVLVAESDGTWTTGSKTFKNKAAALEYFNQKYQEKEGTIIVDDIAAQMK